jgi:DNA helicase II / ATP-dependent DNA helicase PcrA
VESLNQSQLLAARTTVGPLAIIAGPGTGKTKTLTERIRFLIDQGVQPSRILALTFTKKAAQELQTRVANAAVHVATFHGLCFDIIKESSGDAPQFIAEPARLALIKKLVRPAALKGMTVRELSLVISRAKNMASTEPAAAPFVAAYNNELNALGLCDFDDLLIRVRDILQDKNADTFRTRFDYILVDEFQDTNLLQYQLLQLIRGTENICVIGDPQQSIYGFRGADGDIFSRFAADFPQATPIILTVNYRSARAIVDTANAMYPNAPALTAWSGERGMVQAVEVLNEYSEANWVLGEIQKAIGGSDLQRAVSDDVRAHHRTLRDFAIVYRGRAAARTLQKMCADSGIPCQVVGDGSPYDEPAVQAIIQLLAHIADPTRSVAIKDMSAAQIDAVSAGITAAKPYDIAEALVTQFGVDMSPALRQLLGTLLRFATAAEATMYFDEIAAQNFYDPRAEAVTLLTIHAAKGLEFEHVFLIAAEDGVLPSTKGDAEEERRLFYVAVTRARERLDIMYTRQRGGEKAIISPFVTAIPTAILPRVTDKALIHDQRKAAKRHAKRAQTSLF